jgi:hypothetical protein
MNGHKLVWAGGELKLVSRYTQTQLIPCKALDLNCPLNCPLLAQNDQAFIVVHLLVTRDSYRKDQDLGEAIHEGDELCTTLSTLKQLSPPFKEIRWHLAVSAM